MKRIATFFIILGFLICAFPTTAYHLLRLTGGTIAEAETLEYDVTRPHVIINQVYGAGSDGYVSHSFIELYNPSTSDVDMRGGVEPSL